MNWLKNMAFCWRPLLLNKMDLFPQLTWFYLMRILSSIYLWTMGESIIVVGHLMWRLPNFPIWITIFSRIMILLYQRGLTMCLSIALNMMRYHHMKLCMILSQMRLSKLYGLSLMTWACIAYKNIDLFMVRDPIPVSQGGSSVSQDTLSSK